MAQRRGPRPRPMRGFAFWACGALFVVAYLAAAKWAIRFDIGGSVLIWFPPAGVALAGFFLIGPRLYPFAVAAEVVSTAYVTGFGATFGVGANVVNAVV